MLQILQWFVHLYCKRLFLMFHFSDVCCKYFKWMLRMFAMVFMLHLDISKVNRVLHMGCTWKVAGGAGPLLGRSVASPMLLGHSLARCVGSFSCVRALSDTSVVRHPGASIAVAPLYSAEIFLIKDHSGWHGYCIGCHQLFLIKVKSTSQ
jgi:hypothetical protein